MFDEAAQPYPERGLSAALIRKSIAFPWERAHARIGDIVMCASYVAITFTIVLMWLEDLEAARTYALLTGAVGLPTIDALHTATRGGSPGKLAKGLQVVDPDGQMPHYWRCVVRALTLWVPFVVWWPLPLVVVGWALTNRERRGLHDLAAGTTVVRGHVHSILRSAI